MAKTQTELTETEARERFDILSSKAREFFLAVRDFQEAYDPDTVGLDDWTEQMDNVLNEIEEDIDNTFPEEEE